jgi:hypothetical protein
MLFCCFYCGSVRSLYKGAPAVGVYLKQRHIKHICLPIQSLPHFFPSSDQIERPYKFFSENIEFMSLFLFMFQR